MPPKTPATTTPTNAEDERGARRQHRRRRVFVDAFRSGAQPSSDGMGMQEVATTWPIGSLRMRVLVMLPTYNEIENIQDVPNGRVPRSPTPTSS